MVAMRNVVLLLLCVTVVAPIVIYTDRLGNFKSPSSKQEFIDEVTAFAFSAGDSGHLNLLPQETSNALKEPIGVVYTEGSTNTKTSTQDLQLVESSEHISARVLSTTNEEEQAKRENPIKLVTDEVKQESQSGILEETDATGENVNGEDGKLAKSAHVSKAPQITVTKQQQQSTETSSKVNNKHVSSKTNKQNDQTPSDARVRQLKDQLVRARVYLSLPAIKNNPHLTRELRLRIKEVSRTVGDASKDSDLPRNANERMRAMEQSLMKGSQIQDDCAAVVKKLRAMIHSTEEQLRVHKKQTLFLTQLTAKTLPKGLHCLPLRLTTEYYSLNSSQQEFPNQEKLEDPHLYHSAIFSDNILATAVVVNSTVSNAKHPSRHVFHIVTDRLNYAAMRMWFLVNPPGKATIQVQNIEEFTWLNSSYSPVLKQLGSPSMIDYYFRAHRATSDSNLKFRNPKYLSILNHLRFYLPEIFPKLNKVLFLDDDIVVQKDLSGLWSIDLKGNVNGAVETCGENFHRFDRYLNFSNPLIAQNFDPHACGWAYGMNIFDLSEWKRQNITEVYHNWQKLVIKNLVELSLSEKETMVLWHGDFAANLLNTVICFQLYCFHYVKEGDTLPFGFLQKVHNIETLAVACSDSEEIFPSQAVDFDEMSILAQLKGLTMENLSKLNSIGLEHPRLDKLRGNLKILEVCRCPRLTNLVQSSVSFSNLRELLLNKCDGFIYLFTSSTAKTLVNLKKMSIEECGSIKEIVAKEGDESTHDEIIFEKLRELSLKSLPSLASFYTGNSVLKFPSLRVVIIAQCPKTKSFSQGLISAPMLMEIQASLDEDDLLWEGDLNTTVEKMFMEKAERDFIDAIEEENDGKGR